MIGWSSRFVMACDEDDRLIGDMDVACSLLIPPSDSHEVLAPRAETEGPTE